MASWRREGLPTPVFLPGEFHGQRSLVGYSPWRSKESDKAEQQTDTHIHTHTRHSHSIVHLPSFQPILCEVADHACLLKSVSGLYTY